MSEQRIDRLDRDVDAIEARLGDVRIEVAKLGAQQQAHEERSADRHGVVLGRLDALDRRMAEPPKGWHLSIDPKSGPVIAGIVIAVLTALGYGTASYMQQPAEAAGVAAEGP